MVTCPCSWYQFLCDSRGRSRHGRVRNRLVAHVVRKARGKGRRVTPHTLRRTLASLHLVRGTNLKWVQEQGGWASAKMLLDVYGHFMPSESAGYADALTTANGPYTAPSVLRDRNGRTIPPRVARASTRFGEGNKTKDLEPTSGLEPLTC